MSVRLPAASMLGWGDGISVNAIVFELEMSATPSDPCVTMWSEIVTAGLPAAMV